ncbi:MAG: hypothetical protein CM15mP102_15770 [Flavobacteriales bacterium]|nr:MAG: hypothetical protein CM15mP102_15770 [Flavobacteriales bacterium]
MARENDKFFGKRGFNYVDDGWEDNFQEILEKLKKIVNQGKIRHIGLSNENPWGFMKFIEYSKIGLPKMITIQNPYSLLNRLLKLAMQKFAKRRNWFISIFSAWIWSIILVSIEMVKYQTTVDLSYSRIYQDLVMIIV